LKKLRDAVIVTISVGESQHSFLKLSAN